MIITILEVTLTLLGNHEVILSNDGTVTDIIIFVDDGGWRAITLESTAA